MDRIHHLDRGYGPIEETPARIAFEDALAVCFEGINPPAPARVPVIRRARFATPDDVSGKEEPPLGHMAGVAKKIAKEP